MIALSVCLSLRQAFNPDSSSSDSDSAAAAAVKFVSTLENDNKMFRKRECTYDKSICFSEISDNDVPASKYFGEIF